MLKRGIPGDQGAPGKTGLDGLPGLPGKPCESTEKTEQKTPAKIFKIAPPVFQKLEDADEINLFDTYFEAVRVYKNEREIKV